jgi:hypothetical protein
MNSASETAAIRSGQKRSDDHDQGITISPDHSAAKQAKQRQ